LIVQAASAAT